MRPSYLGLAFVHMWIYCSTHRPLLTNDVSVMVVMYSALSLALAVVFFACRRHAAVVESGVDVLDIACAACMSLSAVGLCVQLPVPATLSVAAASALGGVGVAWVYARWCQAYAALDIHVSAPLVMLTMAVGSAGKAVIDYLPDVPAAVVLAILPCATVACFRVSIRDEVLFSDAHDNEAPAIYFNARTIGSLGRLAVGVAVFSLAIGVIQTVLLGSLPFSAHPSVVVHHGSEVVLALGVFVWITVFRRGLNFSRTWRIILILMATALIFEQFIDPAHSGYLLTLVRTAQTLLIVLLFLALADIARHSSYDARAVFAAGWFAYTLPFMIGNLLGTYVETTGSQSTLVLSAVVWVVVMATLLMLDDSAAGNRLIFAQLNDVADDDTLAHRIAAMQESLDMEQAQRAKGTLEHVAQAQTSRSTLPVTEAPTPDVLVVRCDRLAVDCDLTPREREILELIVRGRSKTYIADAFLISENTVRGHVKHIYSKAGVHGKQELLDKVEGM